MKTLTKVMQTCQQSNQPIFIPYIMAGASGLDRLAAEIEMLADNGASAIEIGVPFSDPVADGPTIQAAGLSALANQVTLKKIVRVLQTINTKVPLILMGYCNSFFTYGLTNLLTDVRDTSVKGMIIPDLPYEHRNLVAAEIDASDVALIQLVTLTSTTERIAELTQASEGFVYAVTVNGTTGGSNAFSQQLDAHLQTIRRISPLPVVAGFGISTKSHVERFYQSCDGVVVGSKIVQLLATESLETVGTFVSNLTH